MCLVGVVLRKRVWLAGGIYGCGYHEVGMAALSCGCHGACSGSCIAGLNEKH